jgi:hypothetical protein
LNDLFTKVLGVGFHSPLPCLMFTVHATATRSNPRFIVSGRRNRHERLLRKSVGQVSNLPTPLWSFTQAPSLPWAGWKPAPRFHSFRASQRDMKAPRKPPPLSR